MSRLGTGGVSDGFVAGLNKGDCAFSCNHPRQTVKGFLFNLDGVQMLHHWFLFFVYMVGFVRRGKSLDTTNATSYLPLTVFPDVMFTFLWISYIRLRYDCLHFNASCSGVYCYVALIFCCMIITFFAHWRDRTLIMLLVFFIQFSCIGYFTYFMSWYMWKWLIIKPRVLLRFAQTIFMICTCNSKVSREGQE